MKKICALNLALLVSSASFAMQEPNAFDIKVGFPSWKTEPNHFEKKSFMPCELRQKEIDGIIDRAGLCQFSEEITEILNADPEESRKDPIFIKKVYELATSYVQHKNYLGLQLLAFVIFTKENYPLMKGSHHVLMRFSFDRQHDIQNMYSIFKISFEEWMKSEYRKSQLRCDNSMLKFGWGDDGEKEISILHGGGFFYVLCFLTGQCQGYRLESRGTGLQVSPMNKDLDLLEKISKARAYDYAERKSQFYSDVPVIFIADIKAKYLLAAPNSYEAGLAPSSIPYLSNIRLYVANHVPWMGNLKPRDFENKWDIPDATFKVFLSFDESSR